VETKEINQAVRNNFDKFPKDYIFEISKEEHESLRSKFLTLEKQGRGKHVKYLPKAFTEKGLYMLATIPVRPRLQCCCSAAVLTAVVLSEQVLPV